jgi:uncharacterized C2H2 Zn-finger protein
MGSLINHQKRTKRCLIIQGITPKGEFKCPRCTSTFLTKVSLASHTIACNKKHLAETNANIVIQNKIQELENIENIKQNNLLQAEKIVSLETSLFNMETKYNMLIEEEKTLQDNYNMLQEEKKTSDSKYNTLIEKITNEALSKTNKTTNNTINNISVFNRTDDEIKSIYSENLTIDHIAGGVQAIAKLIVEKVIKDMTGKPMITITDKSRGNAKYKLSTGEVVIDNGLDKFTEKHRDLVIKRMYQVASNPEHFADFLDTESNTCTGYNEIVDDTNGTSLKKNIIKHI